ncbi:MAG: HAD family hydrolase [Wujia sp.]
MKNGLIFDMDGTLWDSAKQVAEAWTVVAQRDYPELPVITTEDVKNVMGLTMDKVADKIFPTLVEEKRYKLLDRCGDYENEYLREVGGELYPELRPTMEKLKEKYHLYIVSNCQSGYIEAFLDHYDFRDLFEDIECYGNNGLKKGDNIRNVVERNKLDKAYYVGDIQGDYVASCEAGIGFIHAAYGFGTIAEKVPELEELCRLPEVADGLFCD